MFEYEKYMTSTQNVQLYNFLKVLFWKYITEIVINFKGHWFDIEQNTDKNLEDFAWILPPTLKLSSRHLHILYPKCTLSMWYKADIKAKHIVREQEF